MAAPAYLYRFGPYELRARTRELYKNGLRLKLRPQTFKVLQLLVERAGDEVTREELRNRLWPSDTFVDFEHGLNTAIRELRGVLSDTASKPRYIETLPKLGYRLVVEVEVESAASPEAGAPGRAADEPARMATKRRQWALPVGLAAVLLLGLASYWQWTRTKARLRLANERVTLAVLPFQNLTGDTGQEYFSDGLTEEVITRLGNLDPQNLGVIARTSVMSYKDTPRPVDQIGRQLGAQYVLEGSVRRDAGQVRISAQLIQVKDQTHLWSKEYDRELKGLLTVQGEIAQEVADEIHLSLGAPRSALVASQPALSPQAYAAYDLYLRGQYFLSKRTVAGFRQAIDSLKQAVEADPNNARAHAALADSYVLLAAYSLAPPSEYIGKARVAALRALQIDPNLAEAHTALALLVQNYDWDWQTAEKEFRRAIELNPNYSTAHHWYAEHLMWRGRFEEAFAESERARQLDPLSLIIAADNGAILYYSRQYDRAIEKWRSVQQMDPDFSRARMIMHAYVEDGMFAEAMAEAERERPTDADEREWYWLTLAYVCGRGGGQVKARRAFDQFTRLQRLHHRQKLDPAALALVYLAMNNKDKALTCLEDACRQHSSQLTSLKVEPAFDLLRGDRRFQVLLHRVGFQ